MAIMWRLIVTCVFSVLLQYKDLLQLLLDATLDEKDIDLANFNDGSSKLSDEEVVMVCEDFILAGYETTGNTLAFISYLLALNPEVQEELQREIQDYYHENPVRPELIIVITH